MFPCPGDDFTVSHDPDLSCDDILPALGGHLYVYSSSIPLVGGGHVDVPASVLEVADFGLLLLYDPIELVDAVVGLFEVLVSDGCWLAYGGDEAVGHGACSGLKVVTHVLWRMVSAVLGDIGRCGPLGSG